MQLKLDETMIDQENDDSFQDEEEHDSLRDEEDDDLTISSDKRSIVEDNSTWSFIPPALQEEERSILPVDSSDSIPSRYAAMSKDNNDDLIFRVDSPLSVSRKTELVDKKEIEVKKPESSANTTDTSVQTEPVADPNINVGQEKSISENLDIIMEIIVEKLKLSRMLYLWIISLMVAIYFLRLSSKQAQELVHLQQEMELLKKTISDLEQAKMRNSSPGWMLTSSRFVKDWASTMIDLNTTDFYFTSFNMSDNIYLDNWPGEAISVVKNISSSVTTIFAEAFDDFSASTRDVLLSASENFASVGDSLTSVDRMTETAYSLSESMLEVWNSQKYALLFGALYYNYFHDNDF